VVLVEDDPGVRLLVTEQLGDDAFEVVPVDPGGCDPLAAIAQANPDAVVLDWRMPGTTGIDLCRALRAAPDGDRFAIVLLTGLSDTRDREVARHAGADAFVVKGTPTAQLTREIERAVGYRRSGQVTARH
jgi:DNA-binding response OmpR family regulator